MTFADDAFQHHPVAFHDLPATWAIASVADLSLAVQPGFPSGRHNIDGRGFLHLRPMNISREGGVDLSEAKYVEVGPADRLADGDVLFNNTNSPALIGKTAVIRSPQNWAFSNHMTRIRPARGIEPAYLAHQLHFLWMTGYFRHRCVNHVNQASISSGPLADTVPLVVPPTAEQVRIVAAIEAQFSRLDAGVAALERIHHQVARLRAAYLHAAVTGSLSGDCRDLEPASDVIARIRTERARRHQDFAPIETPAGRPLPSGWAWSSVGELFTVAVGTTPSRTESSYWGGDIPWVSSGEVAFGRISDTREKITERGLGNPSKRLHPPGTVMLAMIGEGKTRGQCAILDITAAHNQNCASIRVAETEISPEYIFYVLMERYERTRVLASGGNQLALNGRLVSSIPIPLPPVGEQRAIVRRIEYLQSLLGALVLSVDTAVRRSKSLRSSVLSTAFSGRLVHQDPSDEPASVLLERIAATRGSSSGHKAGRASPRPTRIPQANLTT